jgi:hypothetical protein
MKIIKIDWLEESIKEAILTVVDDKFTFRVFSHPCPYKVGDLIDSPLHSLDDDNIVRVSDVEPIIKQVGDTFRHEIVAKVESAKAGLVSVGNVKIELGGYLPGDIVAGDLISFQSWRLDA